MTPAHDPVLGWAALLAGLAMAAAAAALIVAAMPRRRRPTPPQPTPVVGEIERPVPQPRVFCVTTLPPRAAVPALDDTVVLAPLRGVHRAAAR